MKVGFQVEGPSDLLTFSLLVERLLKRRVEPIDFRRRAPGLAGALSTTKRACWHFWRQGCSIAVLAVDGDEAPAHTSDHETEPRPHPECRTCLVRHEVPSLPERPELGPMRVVVAIPVKAQEAWLLFALGVEWPETTPRAELKQRVYGTPNPTGLRAEAVIREIGPRIDLEGLRSHSPSFDAFAHQLTGEHT